MAIGNQSRAQTASIATALIILGHDFSTQIISPTQLQQELPKSMHTTRDILHISPRVCGKEEQIVSRTQRTPEISNWGSMSSSSSSSRIPVSAKTSLAVSLSS